MTNRSRFKFFEEFVGESLAFLSLKNTMKNEFMRNLTLKNDFENAKREFYMNGGFILTHISSDDFEARSMRSCEPEDFDKLVREHINTVTDRLKFKRFGKPSIDKIKEHVWMLKAELE